MPVLNPGSNDYKPKDWRQAYDAFLNFKKAVHTVSSKLNRRIDVSGWHIIVPGRFKGMTDPRWQLVFTNLNGQIETVYIGSDGMTARRTIRDLHNQYVGILVERTKQPSTDPRKLQKTDPRYDHATVARMIKRWNELRKSKSVGEWNARLAANPDLVKFMRSRAGFLDMDMETYLYKHPMSAKWPTPPTTQEQLTARIRQGESYEREIESAKKQSDTASTIDTGPGWMG